MLTCYNVIAYENDKKYNINLKKREMESKNFDSLNSIFNEYALTNEEMICVRGGDGGEPIVVPTPPRPKI